jgi:hypothetical protein
MCLALVALAAAGCADQRWTGPGEYVVKTRGTGPVIADGPYPDISSCNSKLPPLPRDQTVAVCIFLPAPLRTSP